MKAKSIFLNAYLNEVYADNLFNIQSKIKEELGCNFIKPFKFKSRFIRYSFAIKPIIFLIINLWGLLNLFWSCFQFLIYLIKYLSSKKKKIGTNLALEYSGRFRQLLNDVKDIDTNKLEFVSFNKSDDVVSIFQLISIKLLFVSFFQSILAPFWLKSIVDTGYQKILSYSSFKWFMTFNALKDKKFDNIYFANHYDRWAVLFDKLCSKRIILLQHGVLNEKFVPPTKLKNVSVLYSYNDLEKEKFESSILDNFNGEYFYLNRNIDLQPLKGSYKTKVLFISCLPLTFAKEKELLSLFSPDTLVCIKTHPVYQVEPYFDLKREFDIELITEKDFFPDVDFVISYKSTLAFEYELVGKKVIYYEDEDFNNQIQKLVK